MIWCNSKTQVIYLSQRSHADRNLNDTVATIIGHCEKYGHYVDLKFCLLCEVGFVAFVHRYYLCSINGRERTDSNNIVALLPQSISSLRRWMLQTICMEKENSRLNECLEMENLNYVPWITVIWEEGSTYRCAGGEGFGMA
ncbi:hypothetical protein DINM_003774 [Dirofilaria immitis]|nr:hypothetical protein [Dirofilaria immitis]